VNSNLLCVNEVKVVKRTFDYLVDELNYTLWIDNHPSYNSLPLLDYPRHRLTIKGYVPDIIGFNQFEDIIAIEVKGTKDIQKGIGQALLYREGTPFVYLAAFEQSLERVTSTLIQNKIGGIYVSEEKVRKEDPIGLYSTIYLQDLKRELGVMQKEKNLEGRRLTELTKNHLINYLAPIVFVTSDGKEESEIIEKLATYNVKDEKELIKGAKILGLIKEDFGKLILTDEGFLIKTILRHKNKLNLDGLMEIKKETSRKRNVTLATEYPELAITLKMIYAKNEQFTDLLKIIEKQEEKRITFRKLIEEVITKNPNLFLNLICKKEKREEAIKLYQERQESEIYEKKDILVKFITYTTVFTFKKHLIHLGILEPENKLYSGKMENYNPDEDWWILK